jgi:SNF2 family DNA or RNA helicase
MPTSKRRSDTSDSNSRRRNPRRKKPVSTYAGGDASGGEDGDEVDPMEVENPLSSEEEDLEEEGDDEEEEEETSKRSRSKKPKKSAKAAPATLRTSSRSTKFKSSMAEPSEAFKELMVEVEGSTPQKSKGKSPDRPKKSPARRHAKARLSIRPEDDESDSDESLEEEQENEDEDDPLKIQRIIACKTDIKKNWREICAKIQTSEITSGSCWFQPNEDTSDDDAFEERFLVKWKELSFIHCSWETQSDLEELVEGSKGCLRTFFRKSENGLLYSADERCDGDYYDPAFTQIDRILEVRLPEVEGDYPSLHADKEDSYSPSDFGIITDSSDPNYDEALGRRFLVKWRNMPYSDASFEYERDFCLNEIDYKEDLTRFLGRNLKPSKSEAKRMFADGDTEFKRLYTVFGERSKISEAKKEKEVEKYKKDIEEHIFQNGGQLRDYQAEGVAWMMSNYVNGRCSVLADEMGLGKTCQTAAAVNLFKTVLNVSGPILVIAPLSTLAHWKREFDSWTGLNSIVYHGSADDRDIIRKREFAYESDRPKSGVAFNATYLKKCYPKKMAKGESPWMAQVVITTPEMVVTEDYNELTAIQWEALVSTTTRKALELETRVELVLTHSSGG